MLCKALSKARVILVTEALKPDAVSPLGIRVMRSLNEAVDESIARGGRESRVMVIPEGPYVLATTQKSKQMVLTCPGEA